MNAFYLWLQSCLKYIMILFKVKSQIFHFTLVVSCFLNKGDNKGGESARFPKMCVYGLKKNLYLGGELLWQGQDLERIINSGRRQVPADSILPTTNIMTRVLS